MTSESQTCYHCGLSCPNDRYQSGDKFFCCRGCLTAYEILEANDLCDYYDLNPTPGTTPEAAGTETKFAFLDVPEIAADMVDFNDGQRARITLVTPNLHCSSCVWLLENLYKLNPGIERSSVEFLKKTVTITYRPDKISLREIAELLTSLGYEPRMDRETVQSNVDREVTRHLWARIGVAGFAFGNIMLFSLPEYLDVKSVMTESFKTGFSVLNLLLSIPVLFYSSWDYFKSAWAGIRHRAMNMDVPIALGILILYGRSVFELISQSGPGWMDSFAGLVFLLLLGKLFQEKTYQALSFERDYKTYFPLAVTRRTSFGEETLPLAKLKKGDRVLVRNNEIIPADAVLINGQARIDYAFVTGEESPVELTSGDQVFAGGRQQGGVIEVDIVRDVNQSYLTRLWNQDVFHKDRKQAITTLADKISRYFTGAVLSIAFGAAIYWGMHSPELALNAFTAVLIVACPCALALSTPFTLGNALRILGANGFYLKNTRVVESLATVNTAVFDKTGTLTDPQQSRLVFTSATDSNKDWPDQADWEKIVALARQSTHPLSRKIVAEGKLESLPEVQSFEEIPGRGISGLVNGKYIKIGSRKFVSGEEGNGALVSEVAVSIDGIVLGTFGIQNRLRKNLDGVLTEIGNNLETWMVSGDTDSEASTFKEFFSSPEQLMFRQSPEDKLHLIEKLQSAGNRVLMMGDGLNDAGALKQSDAGISITEDVNTFSPACDAILDARSFQLLPRILRYAKTSLGIIKWSFVLSFLYNVGGISFAVTGRLSPLLSAILMPLSSISVVLFTTLTTNLRARQLGLKLTERKQ